jgi:transcriptional regulator with XRE-family HTH domain
MSVYKSFAANLREQCARSDSIAEVCRNIGINRQQFNKYLSAKSLPNSRNLTKLCTYLKIEEEALFVATQVQRDSISHNFNDRALVGFDFIDTTPELLKTMLGFDVKLSFSERTLMRGYYNCYFPLQNTSKFLVRSLIKISNFGSMLTFHRRTRFNSPSNRKRSIAIAKHVGLVFNDQSTIYLIGHNKLGPQNLSFVALENRRIAGAEILSGIALVQGLNRPYSCRISMEWIGAKMSNAKSAMMSIGIVEIHDKSVHPVVSLILASGKFEIKGQTSIPPVEQSLVSAN